MKEPNCWVRTKAATVRLLQLPNVIGINQLAIAAIATCQMYAADIRWNAAFADNLSFHPAVTVQPTLGDEQAREVRLYEGTKLLGTYKGSDGTAASIAAIATCQMYAADIRWNAAFADNLSFHPYVFAVWFCRNGTANFGRRASS
jgi:hypothetical protein